MRLSDAERAARGSPRSRIWSNCARIIRDITPRLRCVGRTVTSSTNPNFNMPPGMVIADVRVVVVPTISSPSNAPKVLSNSANERFIRTVSSDA